MWENEKYKKWLKDRLIETKNNLDFNNYNIEVFNEQDYAKKRSIKPNTITVIVKFLASTLIYGAKTQPIQMLIIAEENSISVANSIVSNFCEDYNFYVAPFGSTYVKNMYSTPVVLSNFNLIGIGMRTVLYVNTTLFILEEVMDITNITVQIDGVTETVNGNTVLKTIPVEAMSATVGYTMQGDTQPYDSGYAITEKNFATFVMTINVACIKNDFTQYVVEIMNKTHDGDAKFSFSFSIGDITFSGIEMVLTGATISTAVNNVPSLQLSFSV